MELIVKNLVVAKEGEEVLKGVNFFAKGGEILLVTGENGSGKTTLALALAGWKGYDPLRGRVAFRVGEGHVRFADDDLEFLSTSDRAKKGIFLAPQSIPELEGVSVLELLQTELKALGKEMDFAEVSLKAQEIAKELKLKPAILERDFGAGFSGGEKKKVEMLQLLMLEPNFAILDEVDSGLDAQTVGLFVDTVKKLKESGKIIMVISHNEQVIEELKPVSKQYVMTEGRLGRILVKPEWLIRSEEKRRQLAELQEKGIPEAEQIADSVITAGARNAETDDTSGDEEPNAGGSDSGAPDTDVSGAGV